MELASHAPWRLTQQSLQSLQLLPQQRPSKAPWHRMCQASHRCLVAVTGAESITYEDVYTICQLSRQLCIIFSLFRAKAHILEQQHLRHLMTCLEARKVVLPVETTQTKVCTIQPSKGIIASGSLLSLAQAHYALDQHSPSGMMRCRHRTAHVYVPDCNLSVCQLILVPASWRLQVKAKTHLAILELAHCRGIRHLPCDAGKRTPESVRM